MRCVGSDVQDVVYHVSKSGFDGLMHRILKGTSKKTATKTREHKAVEEELASVKQKLWEQSRAFMDIHDEVLVIEANTCDSLS